jgi:hypothetical protein
MKIKEALIGGGRLLSSGSVSGSFVGCGASFVVVMPMAYLMRHR